jgi:hypothetical protein
VVQVSSGGQFIAVAVSPESAAQTTGGQQSGQYSLAGICGKHFAESLTISTTDSAAVASSAATASTDEDDGQSGFDDFATAAYTNGANSASAMSVPNRCFVIAMNLTKCVFELTFRTYYTTDSYTTATAYYNSGVSLLFIYYSFTIELN